MINNNDIAPLNIIIVPPIPPCGCGILLCGGYCTGTFNGQPCGSSANKSFTPSGPII